MDVSDLEERSGLKVAVTGHRDLCDAEVVVAVREGLLSKLRSFGDPASFVGLSCLAEGADQIFAEVVLGEGGAHIAVVPCRKYDSTFSSAGLATFRQLLGVSAEQFRLDHDNPTDEAFVDAAQVLINKCDRLIAVWDGEPGAGPGGTADVVDRAHRLEIPVDVVWPSNAYRGEQRCR